MMTRLVRISIAVHLMLSATFLSAQHDACVKDVLRMYNNLSNKVKANKNGLYLKYNYEVEVKLGEKIEKNSLVVEVKSDQSNSIFLTKDMSVFQDKKNTVSVFDDKKLVVINRYVGDAYKQDKIDQFQLIQDTIFDYVSTKECKSITSQGKTYKKVLVQCNAEGRKLFKVNTIEFLLNEKENRIRSVKVKYVPGHRFYAMKVEFIDQQLDYQLTHIKREALTNVFTASGKLLSRYEGYQLIDNRN